MVNTRKIEYYMLWAMNTHGLFKKYFFALQEKYYKEFLQGKYHKAEAIRHMAGLIPDILRYHKSENGCYHHLRQEEIALLATEIIEDLTEDICIGGDLNE